VDSFFDEEIDRIRRTERYITSEQLKKFIFDFLKYNCPRTRVEYNDVKRIGHIFPDSQLLSLIGEYGNSLELSNFFSADGTRLTFDSEVAFQNQNVEFISSTHPFTNMVIRFYEHKELKFNNAYHVVLKTDKLDRGKYFYFIFRLRVNAAKDSNTLEAIFIDENLKEVCSDEDAEILLGEMLEKGRNADMSFFDLAEEFINNAYRTSKSIFMDRLKKLKELAEHNNNLLVEGRVASIKLVYGKRIKQKQKQLDKGRRENKDKRYLIMLDSEIKRLTSDLDSAISREEAKRVVGVEYDEVAAGILEIR
jgi:hypothetical protein